MSLLSLFFSLLSPTACLATGVLLAWDPSPDADLAGYNVYYQANSGAVPFNGTGALEGSAPVQGGTITTASISGLDPANSYYFAVAAYNSAGTESPYSNIVQIPETLPPSVSIISPVNNAAVSGILAISAAASDNAGVAAVQFLVDGTQVHETATAPYTYAWDASSLAPGTYSIVARAIDVSGNQTQSGSVTVSVLGDVTSPTVSLAVPPADTKIGGTINVSVSASDNTGVTRLEIAIDGSVVMTGNQSPASYIWNTNAFANGSHTVSAMAYDAAGNTGIASATVLVDNVVQPDNTAQTATATTSTSDTPTSATTNTSTSPTSPTSPTSITTISTSTTSTSTTQPVSEPLSLADAQLALQIASGSSTPHNSQLQRLDLAPYLNGQSLPNGKVDTGDVVVILSMLTGRI